jgi:hypothetical protein
LSVGKEESYGRTASDIMRHLAMSAQMMYALTDVREFLREERC